jgi:hypothetical protein
MTLKQVALKERILGLVAQEQYQIPFAELVRKAERLLEKRGNKKDQAEAEELFNRWMKETDAYPGPALVAALRLAVAAYDFARAHDPKF